MRRELLHREISNEIVPEFEREIESLAGKTILITGASGLIPSYLVDTIVLANRRKQLRITLILVNKHSVNSESRLGHLLGNPDIIFVTADVGNPFQIPFKPHVIIHAASRASPASFLADPMDTINANVKGAWFLLDFARENGVEQFIFFSSAEIYGNPVREFIPTPETYFGNADPLNTWSCYIESKRFVESLCMAYFRQYGLPIKILRILLVYGPGMRDDGKVISDFFKSAIQQRKISLKDKGDARRSFCYISDATRAIFTVWFKGKNGEAYNIADDTNNNSIYELAKKISSKVGADIPVEANMMAPVKEIYGVNNRLASMDKVRSLGYVSRVTLDEGLARLYAFYNDQEKHGSE
jgi:UDP-glucuronate decarboxylase